MARLDDLRLAAASLRAAIPAAEGAPLAALCRELRMTVQEIEELEGKGRATASGSMLAALREEQGIVA